MEVEKYFTPLTVAAGFIAIYLFTRTLKPTPEFTAGAAPTPMTIPSWGGIPNISYNVATPTPPPVQPGTGIVAGPPPTGVTVNKGFGAPTAVEDMPNPSGCNGCGGNSYKTPQLSDDRGGDVFTWYPTNYLNSML